MFHNNNWIAISSTFTSTRISLSREEQKCRWRKGVLVGKRVINEVSLGTVGVDPLSHG